MFPFSFTIPDGYLFFSRSLVQISVLFLYRSFECFSVVFHRRLPSSYKGAYGKIIHKVKAELKQSMRLTKKAKAHFTFVSKADMGIPGLMVRNH